ncbi:hypothetical protein [Bradyrhizobium sp. AZCC 2289]|uniref:hypothetical protein n=1 Tax=Bradyrhizobium sp. AZCC 2289 TaxID=3117026 RepID=UPI002FF33CBB
MRFLKLSILLGVLLGAIVPAGAGVHGVASTPTSGDIFVFAGQSNAASPGMIRRGPDIKFRSVS